MDQTLLNWTHAAVYRDPRAKSVVADLRALCCRLGAHRNGPRWSTVILSDFALKKDPELRHFGTI